MSELAAGPGASSRLGLLSLTSLRNGFEQRGLDVTPLKPSGYALASSFDHQSRTWEINLSGWAYSTFGACETAARRVKSRGVCCGRLPTVTQW